MGVMTLLWSAVVLYNILYVALRSDKCYVNRDAVDQACSTTQRVSIISYTELTSSPRFLVFQVICSKNKCNIARVSQ